jgi:cytoskeletal protein CcmA (bactofilin family)
MFNKSKTNNVNPSQVDTSIQETQDEQVALVDDDLQAQPVITSPAPTPNQRSSMMDMISTAATKPSILSEGFSFRGEITAKGAIHVEGALNGQIQVDELTIGARGQVEGVVIVTSSASVDGHVVYQTLSVQKGASIKGELLLVK